MTATDANAVVNGPRCRMEDGDEDDVIDDGTFEDTGVGDVGGHRRRTVEFGNWV